MHISVLLNEAIEGLNIKDGGIYVDCTLGYAGHSKEILKRNKKGWLYAFDQDEEAIEYANERLSKINDNFTIIHSNFANMKEKLAELGARLFRFKKAFESIDSKQNALKKKMEAIRYEL